LRENIELYNSAYRLAWKPISERQKREQPNIARRLHDSIRRYLKDGETEPVFIASEALKVLEESEPRSENKGKGPGPKERARRRGFKGDAVLKITFAELLRSYLALGCVGHATLT
jgi:hypothetical protein